MNNVSQSKSVSSPVEGHAFYTGNVCNEEKKMRFHVFPIGHS